MSLETLAILNQQRADQIELSPSSEEFTFAGGSFYGIFDEAHLEDSKDKGNVFKKKLTPLIMVAEVPAGLTPETTDITRENGDIFTFMFAGKDEEGIPILWLSSTQ